MKKIMLVAGLLSVPTIGAGPAKVALVGITSPVLIPGAYYATKSYLEQKHIKENYKDTSYEQAAECDAQLAHARQKFNSYSDGVAWGLGFPINVALLSGQAKKLSAPVVNVNEMNAEQTVGFFSGLSVYATTAGLLAVVKALKK